MWIESFELPNILLYWFDDCRKCSFDGQKFYYEWKIDVSKDSSQKPEIIGLAYEHIEEKSKIYEETPRQRYF